MGVLGNCIFKVKIEKETKKKIIAKNQTVASYDECGKYYVV